MIDWTACAAVFRARIGDRKLTAVASRAGINRSHLSQILNGTRHPSLDVFAALCRELRVTPNEVSRVLGLTPSMTVAEGAGEYVTEPPPTVEVFQEGATLTLVVQLKPHRARPHSRPEEES